MLGGAEFKSRGRGHDRGYRVMVTGDVVPRRGGRAEQAPPLRGMRMNRRWIVGVGVAPAVVCGGGAVIAATADSAAARAQGDRGGLRAITLDDLFAIRPVEGPRVSP